MTSPPPERRHRTRWQGALDVLSLLRRVPGITRAELARRAGLSSGSATEIVARLRQLALVQEAPAPAVGRGRPTTLVGAHPDGPLVLAVDLRQEDWRVAAAGLDAHPAPVAEGRHLPQRDPRAVLSAVGEALAAARARYGRRVRAVSVAVAGTVQRDRLVQASTLGWGAVDLAPSMTGSTLPLLVGNDATLAGVAEARMGAATGARAVLHLTVEVGIGGILVVDGVPVTGATGAGGEFGHMPLVPSQLRCPCGARGCWDLLVDGRALARHLGAPAPENPRTFARLVLGRASSERGAKRAVDATAGDFGAGVAALVNALDPDVVTLGGLAAPLFAAGRRAFLEGFTAGLMAFRRESPPEMKPAAFEEDGALRGAVEVGLDAILAEGALEDWARGR